MTKVLIVEDDTTYCWGLLRKLSAFFDVEGVSTLSQAIKAFGSNTFGAVLLDLGLPDSVTDETVATMKHEYPNCAIVVLSGYENPERIKRCISDSASSYLVKGRDDQNPEILATAIRTAINSNQACQKAERVRKEIENSAEI